MNSLQFNRTNPAIAAFYAGQQLDDQRRQREEAQFDRRFQQDQARGVDAAVRTGLGAMYARPPAMAAPVAAPASVSPPPAPVPAPGPVSIEPAHGGDTPIGDIVVDQPAEMPQTGGLPAPAIASATAQAPAAAAAAPQGSRYGPMMESLARTPGGGATMMQMHKENVAEDTRRQAAEIQAIRAMHNAEPDIAAAIAARYNINIPPDFIKNKRAQYEMTQLGTMLKQIGVNDDNMAVQITRQYLEARKGGMEFQQALEAALQGAKAGPKASDMTYDSMRGAWVTRPTAESPTGTVLQPPNMPPRQTGGGGGAGGGGSKQREYAEWRIRTLVAAGMSEQQAAQIVAGRGTVTPKDIATMATRLMRLTNENGDRIYNDLPSATRAAQEALGQGGGGGAPAPRPQPGGAGAGTGGVNGSPYPEGTRLRGRDGATYTVKGGVPVKD